MCRLAGTRLAQVTKLASTPSTLQVTPRQTAQGDGVDQMPHQRLAWQGHAQSCQANRQFQAIARSRVDRWRSAACMSLSTDRKRRRIVVDGQRQLGGCSSKSRVRGREGSDTHTSGREALYTLEISAAPISQRSLICVEEAVRGSKSTPQFVGPPEIAQTRCTTIARSLCSRHAQASSSPWLMVTST